jgi:hypothetical protein
MTLDTPDFQSGVVSPQVILATFAQGSHGGVVMLPVNCETLVIVTSGASDAAIPEVVGVTTGIHYVGLQLQNVAGGLWAGAHYYYDVSDAADAQVNVELQNPYYPGGVVVYADSGVHVVVDPNIGAAIVFAGYQSPAIGLQVEGTDGKDARIIRVDELGRLYAIPSVPDTAAGDHPPVEIQVAAFSSVTAAQTLLAAPGAGLRYRIFGAVITDSSTTAGNGAISAVFGGVTTRLVTGAASQDSASMTAPATGLVTDTNTLIAIAASATCTLNGAVFYTLETV